MNRSAEANQPLPVKLLTEEVTKRGDIPFAEGRYCEVWVGYWSKGGGVKDGGEEIGNEGTNSKKVSASLTISIPLMESFVDSVEGAQDT